MLRVGLTGGIASGKSTVARLFRELGAHVIDADRVAREVATPDSPGFGRIVRAFGEGILRSDGTLDRARLGEVVFADPAKRRVLEGILHPLILAEVDRRIAEIGVRDPDAIVVVEAALILELGRQGEFDALVVVWASREEQLRRIGARDGLGAGEAARRVDSQMPLEEKRRLADFVIDNGGDPQTCRDQAREVFAALEGLARGRRR